MEATTTTTETLCDCCDVLHPASELRPAGGEGTSVPEGMFCESCLGID